MSDIRFISENHTVSNVWVWLGAIKLHINFSNLSFESHLASLACICSIGLLALAADWVTSA